MLTTRKAFFVLLCLSSGLIPAQAHSQVQITCVYDTGSDCNYWWDYAVMYDNGSIVGGYMVDTGVWSDPNVLESVVVSGTGPCQHIPPITIHEPANCLASSACRRTPRYFMYTFRDDNQPETWLEYCYIISNNGYPGVESQARICTVPGFDYEYRATKMEYAGWVYADCSGHATYGWPDWQPAWYRPEFAK